MPTQVGFPPDMLLLSPRRQRGVRGSLQKAAEAAADNLARQAGPLQTPARPDCPTRLKPVPLGV